MLRNELTEGINENIYHQNIISEDMMEKDYKQAKLVFRNKPDKKNIISSWKSPLNFFLTKQLYKINNYRQPYKYNELISPARCYKCLQFGHVRKYGRSERQFICISCNRDDNDNKHHTLSNTCLSYIRAKHHTKNNTQYRQHNLQRSNVATVETRQVIKEKLLYIILVQEPYAVKGDIKCLEQTLEIISKKQLSTEKIKDFILICFISAYFPPSEIIQNSLLKLQKRLNLFRGHNITIIVDTNSKSKLWYWETEDERENQRSITTYDLIHGPSNIDITLCTAKLYKHCKKWQREETA
ncbi:hypothetical protein PR048_018730, partial [Dryococelus australis]